jgi:serine/threonine-protein kinase
MATENPYSAPTARVADAAPEIPEDIRKKIKSAWVAAAISGSITLVVTLISMSGTDILGFSAWELIDVGLIFGLAFGIYRKSRACAVVMLSYFIISKIILMVESGKPSGVVLSIIFIYYFWQGVSGTFAYHKLKNRSPALAASGG